MGFNAIAYLVCLGWDEAVTVTHTDSQDNALRCRRQAGNCDPLSVTNHLLSKVHTCLSY